MSEEFCKVEDCISLVIEDGFCKRHLTALENIKNQYEKWKEALGEIKWEDYLKALANDEPGNVGKNVIEIAKLLLDG
ncbi:MAG: hypothetical protein D6732_19100 [Methanobacteriota archaeon]|nr:MAG: hypothetical protein D6732_19100 [Euryarchaeota archaeon]